jgi:NAD(P)-dependent dehydrogenase (short-subunit alcohol dehydrogenase family)
MPVAMITGGGGRIGQGIAEALLADGWRLFLTDKNADNLQEVADALKGGKDVVPMVLDVKNYAEVQKAVAIGIDKLGPFEALANTAGGSVALGTPKIPYVETTMQHRRNCFDVNLFGTLNVIHCVLPGMKTARKGSIISVASGAGLRGGPPEKRQRQAAIYASAKAALIAFTQGLAEEVGPYGVRVNTIVPGMVPSRWKTPEIMAAQNEKFEKEAKGSGRLPPMGRNSSPKYVGQAVAFVLSDRAENITGCTLDTSGGGNLH